MRALLVEDNDLVRDTLEIALSLAGYEIVSAANASAARAAFLASPEFCAVIIDYDMPGETGVDFLRWLRMQPRGEDLPCIAIPGRGGDFVGQFRTLGAYVLPKPFPGSQLLACLAEQLAAD